MIGMCAYVHQRQEDKHMNAHRNTIRYSSKMETTQESINSRMNKCLYIHIIDYYAPIKKEQTTATHKNME